MKRFLLLPIILIFLVSCAGLQLTDNQTLTVKKLSRIAGITFAMEKSEEIDQALSYLDYISGLEDSNLKKAAIDIAVKYAYEKYGKTSKTVILVAEVVDLINVIVPETGQPDIDLKLLDIAVAGFREGIILAK